MMICERDRHYLENKYHKTDEPFDGTKRMAYHGYEYDPDTGMSDDEIDEALSQLVKGCAYQPRPVIKARAVAFVLDNTRIDINESDFFIGMYSWGRLPTKHTVDVWHGEAQRKAEKLMGYNANARYGSAGAFWASLDFDHSVPDWDSLFELGFSGILKRAECSYNALKESGELTEKQEAFFRAAEIEYKAILRFVDRLYKLAVTKKFEKATEIAECLAALYNGAPQNTYQALQLMYIYFMVSESVDHYQVRSLGYGLDASLYPFYKKDLESGRYTEEQLSRFIAYFLMQFSAIGHYWGQPMYLGGTNPDGTTKINELSYLILDICDKLGIYNPKIQIKYHSSTPKDFILKALNMIRGGSNSIVFCNEDTIVKAMMRAGATYEQALDSVVKGCYEYAVKADCMAISLNPFNALKPIRWVFNNGFDTETNRFLGVKTGEIEEFDSFDKFYAAYLTQFDFIIQTALEYIGYLECYVQDVNPSILYSATIPKCVKTLTDAMDGGIRNVSDMWLNGLASAVDSLMAVKELVFERRVTTLGQLRDAINSNWKGYEKLRLIALNCQHKYGNGDAESDFYAGAIHNFFASRFMGRKNCHGGNIEYELHSALNFINCGRATGATPDGRYDGDETSKNASPTQGADRNGVTALIKSATSFDLSLADSGACLDCMMHPSSVQGENGLSVFYSLLKTYMQFGGASIHFNVFDAKTLRDAQAHPEKYRSLQVRVCGWNVLWNNLSEREQNAYIKRAESIAQ